MTSSNLHYWIRPNCITLFVVTLEVLQGKRHHCEWTLLNCPVHWRLTLWETNTNQQLFFFFWRYQPPLFRLVLSWNYPILIYIRFTWHTNRILGEFFLSLCLFLSSGGPQLKTKSCDFLGCHCLFKNMSAFYWVVFVLLLQPRGLLRRDLRFTPFAWQFSVKNWCSSSSGASILPPGIKTNCETKSDTWGASE